MIINKQWGFLLGIVGGWTGGCQMITPSASNSSPPQPVPLISATLSPATTTSVAPVPDVVRVTRQPTASGSESGSQVENPEAQEPVDAEPDSVVVLPGTTAGTTLTFPNTGNPPQATPEVKRWIRNRPVVDVTLNGTVQFEAVLDPQASNTEITGVVAQLLELPITQQVVQGTPDRPRLLGQGTVSTLAIGDLRLSNLLVTVGDENLKVSILGKDVLDNVQISTTDRQVVLTPREISP